MKKERIAKKDLKNIKGSQFDGPPMIEFILGRNFKQYLDFQNFFIYPRKR